MIEPPPRRGPLSTISGWMIGIAVIAVTMATVILSPFVFVVANFVLLEGVAFIRFRESRRRRPMSALAEIGWVFVFLVAVPVVSIVASAIALYAYCSVNPNTLP